MKIMTPWRDQSEEDFGVTEPFTGTTQGFETMGQQSEELHSPQYYTDYGQKNRGLLGYFLHLRPIISIISAISVVAMLFSRDSMRLEAFSATFIMLTAVAAGILNQMFFRGRLQFVSWVVLIATAMGVTTLIF